MTHLAALTHKSPSISGLEIVTSLDKKNYTPTDIAFCICIRASAINPWVLERLEFVLNYYSPQPYIQIVDFGSEEPYATIIREKCQALGAHYHYVDDKDTFALAKARNISVQLAPTDLVLLSDIDYVYDRDIFLKLANMANRLEIARYPRRMLTMPIFHVGKEATAQFFALNTAEDKDHFIADLSWLALGTAFGQEFEFVAPYSNAMFIHKDLFNLAGGYCDAFRGHGSEDFEFFIRLGLFASTIPESDSMDKDFYGPLKDSFWTGHDYLGFRRFIEVFTMPSEAMGLKAFHMYHEKPAGQGYWTAENDWKRNRFNQIIQQYLNKRENILEIDYLPREKTALCIFSDKKHWGYFLPLRNLGFKLKTLSNGDDESLKNAYHLLENSQIDEIFIFNPYMKSHVRFRGLIEYARRTGTKVTIIERGGLPNTIYYADEVAYGDPDYREANAILQERQPVNLELTRKYRDYIIAGEASLEASDEYIKTWQSFEYTLFRTSTLNKVFIPLQLRDDMAVNYFTEGYINYESYEQQIKLLVETRPDCLFVIKQHPLSKENPEWLKAASNVILAQPADNVHAIIDCCDLVVTYNSGVGLLALLHHKPVYHFGNAYYGLGGTLATAISSADELDGVLNHQAWWRPDENAVLKMLDWLIFEKYSWFSAEDVIREFEFRKAHGYDKIIVERICWRGRPYNIGLNSRYKFSEKSYLGWRSRMMLHAPQPVKQSTTQEMKTPQEPAAQSVTKSQAVANSQKVKLQIAKPLVEEQEKRVVPAKSTTKAIQDKQLMLIHRLFMRALPEKKQYKLLSNPEAFFADSHVFGAPILKQVFLSTLRK